MRLIALLLLAACGQVDVMPPLLGDFDGAVRPPSYGGGGGGGGGQDGGVDASDFTILAPAFNPKGFSIDGASLFFTNFATGSSDGTVSVVPTEGGGSTDLVTGLSSPWALVAVSGVVYFTLAPTAGPGSVQAVPEAGGSVTPVQSTSVGAVGIASDGSNLFWTLASSGTVIEAVSLAGGTPVGRLDIGGDLQPQALALDPSTGDLYVATTGTQAAVLHGSTQGGNLEPLDTQASQTFGDVTFSATTVYATLDDVAPAGQILSFPRGTGSPLTVATGLDHPQRLALDGNNLYFTDPDGGNVWVVDVSTTPATPVVFASGLSSPLPIVVADAVYVGEAGDIVRIPKL